MELAIRLRPDRSAPPSSRRAGGARVVPPPHGGARGRHVCVFWLGGQRYALDAAAWCEVVAVHQAAAGAAHPAVDARAVATCAASRWPWSTWAAPGAGPARGARRRDGLAGGPALVLRVDGILLAGIRVDRIEAVYAFEGVAPQPARPRSASITAVRGLLAFGAKGGRARRRCSTRAELGRRGSTELRFRDPAGAGRSSTGGTHVAKAETSPDSRERGRPAAASSPASRS